jgi:hypothetical protein
LSAAKEGAGFAAIEGDGCSFHPRPRSTRAQSLASAGRVYAAGGEAAPNNLNLQERRSQNMVCAHRPRHLVYRSLNAHLVALAVHKK